MAERKIFGKEGREIELELDKNIRERARLNSNCTIVI